MDFEEELHNLINDALDKGLSYEDVIAALEVLEAKVTALRKENRRN